MSEHGGLLAVAAADVVELHPSEGKCLREGIDNTCTAVGDMCCNAVTDHEELDGQTNGYDGPENCFTDSGISDSTNVDVCGMQLLDDSEATDEGCTLHGDNQTVFATRQEETFSASKLKEKCTSDTGMSNLANNLCPESEMNGDFAVAAVLSEDGLAGKNTVCGGNGTVETSGECNDDISNNDNLLSNAVDASVQSNQQSVETVGDHSVVDEKVDDSSCNIDVPEVSPVRADGEIESCPNVAEVVTAEVESLPADKSVGEEGAAVTSENAVVTSAAGSQLNSQPTFTSSRFVPRPSRQSHPRMGSYGSPPPSAAPSSSCPDDDASKQQYIVNVHVNPGETFSVCVSDQVQLIQGVIFVHYMLISINCLILCYGIHVNHVCYYCASTLLSAVIATIVLIHLSHVVVNFNKNRRCIFHQTVVQRL